MSGGVLVLCLYETPFTVSGSWLEETVWREILHEWSACLAVITDEIKKRMWGMTSRCPDTRPWWIPLMPPKRLSPVIWTNYNSNSSLIFKPFFPKKQNKKTHKQSLNFAEFTKGLNFVGRGIYGVSPISKKALCVEKTKFTFKSEFWIIFTGDDFNLKYGFNKIVPSQEMVLTFNLYSSWTPGQGEP